MGKRSHLYYNIFMWLLLLITSTKLAGNGIGKFRLPVENSKNRIFTYSENKAGYGVLTAQHSTDRCPNR